MKTLAQLLDDVYARCIPDGECMNWTGAVQSCGKSPAIRAGRRGTSLRRLMLETASKRKIDPQGRATYTCGNKLCVRLEHLALVSRKTLQLRNESELNALQRLLKSQRIKEKARLRSKLTMEIAKSIMADESPQREIAKKYNISQTTVGSIKRGLTWQDASNPFLRLAA